MTISVLESKLASKSGRDRDCEDGIVTTSDFAAVIDGATSESGVLWDGKTPGRVAAEILEEAIRTLPRTSSANEAVAHMSGRLAELYKRRGLVAALSEDPSRRAAASVAVYSRHRSECWTVGDCQVLIGDRHHQSAKAVDGILAAVRALVLEAALREGATTEALIENDRGREYIEPLLRRQAAFQNAGRESPFDYGVVDGFAVDPSHVTTIPVPETVHTLVLASDGYPSLAPTLEESEARLKVRLEADPLCIHELRSTKGRRPGCESYDDRAYLRIAIG